VVYGVYVTKRLVLLHIAMSEEHRASSFCKVDIVDIGMNGVVIVIFLHVLSRTNVGLI
jgi:hypothetical protein